MPGAGTLKVVNYLFNAAPRDGTTLATFALCGLGWALLYKPNNDTERLYKSLFTWAIYWLILGLFFEPYEGGIRKDKATVSYYFVTSGLAICVFIGAISASNRPSERALAASNWLRTLNSSCRSLEIP